MRSCLLVLALALLPLAAQINTADLSGTITDESGAVVPAAEVTLQGEDTGARRLTHTDQAGRYGFEQLAVGKYRITAQLLGFQTEVATGIDLTVGRKASLNLRLRVGEVTTQTSVTANAELVETRDAGLSTVMENTALRELPLNGRDVAELALLQPGVAPSLRGGDSG